MTQPHAFLFSGCDFDPDAEIAESALSPNIPPHLKALRVRVGETVSFLDGAGKVFDALCLKSKPFEFRIVRFRARPAPRAKLSLCLSPPRRETLAQTLSQATEMGVSEIRFLITDHNDYAAKEHEPLLTRARRVLEASVEQCRAPFLPKMGGVWIGLAEALECLTGPAFFADEDLSRRGLFGPAKPVSTARFEEISLFIGPEGGWSPRERGLIEKSDAVIPLGLGPQILKVPTACVAALYQMHLLAGREG